MKRYIPLSKWNEFHPWPTPGSLRFMAKHPEKYNFYGIVSRPNGRLLIDEEAFLKWAEEGKAYSPDTVVLTVANVITDKE